MVWGHQTQNQTNYQVTNEFNSNLHDWKKFVNPFLSFSIMDGEAEIVAFGYIWHILSLTRKYAK